MGWSILGYEDIIQITENIWRVIADTPASKEFKRNMLLFRCDDGRLLIHSCVAMKDEDMKILESIGKPTWLFIPNGMHRYDAAFYKERYPEIKVYTPKGALKKVSKLISVDHHYGEFNALENCPNIDVAHWEGVKKREGFLKLQSEDGCSLVVNDIIFNHKHCSGFMGSTMKFLGSTGGLKVTPTAKMLLVDDKALLKKDMLDVAADQNIQRLFVAHVDYMKADVAVALRQIADNI